MVSTREMLTNNATRMFVMGNSKWKIFEPLCEKPCTLDKISTFYSHFWDFVVEGVRRNFVAWSQSPHSQTFYIG